MIKSKLKEIDFKEAVIRSSSSSLSEVDFIKDKQVKAVEKLGEINFPHRKQEDWKYYDFADILESEFNIEGSSFAEDSGLDDAEIASLIDKYVFRETAENLIVTINGAYSSKFSSFDFSNEEICILNFNKLNEIKSHNHCKSIIKNNFASEINEEPSYFKAINTALINDGFLLAIKENHQSTKPLQVLHISNKNNFNQTRALIHAGKNSKQEIIVSYIGMPNSNYFTNAVIECHLEDGAHLKLDKVQNESSDAIRLYDFKAELNRDCNFVFNAFSFGAKSSRDNICVNLNGPGSHADVNGLYVLNDKRKSHHIVTINHNVPNCTSGQLFKGILQDESRAEFNGLIEVARDAQQTDATQLNKNLLLSNKAHVDSRPQLNILADDVKCAHGSTAGQLSEEELFYLQSRGFEKDYAKSVLTYSFCKELIDKISLESARNYAANLAFSIMSSQETGKETINNLENNSKFKHGRYSS